MDTEKGKVVGVFCPECNRSWDRENFEKGGLFTGKSTSDESEVERRVRSWLAGHQHHTGHFAKIQREDE